MLRRRTARETDRMSEHVLSPQTALIYTMVLLSAADREMTDEELGVIGDIVRLRPVFQGYSQDALLADARACAERVGGEGGLDGTINLIVASLPDSLRETAYAFACEVAASDLHVGQEESRLLELLRYRLPVGRLPAAAIERGIKALYKGG